MKSLVAILLVLSLTFTLTNCGPRPAITPLSPGIEVNLLEDQRVLPDGNANDLNVSKAGTTKRLRIEVIPNGNTIPDTEVKLQFSLNHRRDLALTYATALVATRQSGTPNTNSIFFVDVPGSGELTRCEWFHYSWYIKYHRPGQSYLRNGYSGQLRSFLITSAQSQDYDLVDPPPCEDVP